jgi:hypothetical protein
MVVIMVNTRRRIQGHHLVATGTLDFNETVALWATNGLESATAFFRAARISAVAAGNFPRVHAACARRLELEECNQASTSGNARSGAIDAKLFRA